MAQNEQFQNPSRDKRGARDGQGGQEACRPSARGDFRGRDSRKSGPSGRGASRGNGASRSNGGSRGKRGFRGNGRPHNDWGSRGDGASRSARGDVELAATEPAFEPLPAQYPLMVGNIDGGRKVEVLCRDKGADQFAARLRKVAKDRRKWARDNDISCYRVYDADLPDFAVAIDRYDRIRWSTWGRMGCTLPPCQFSIGYFTRAS